MRDVASLLDALSDDAVWRLEQICTRFEEQWLRGEKPQIEEAVSSLEPAERPVAILELLRLEGYYNRGSGSTPSREQIAARFPDAVAILNELFDAGPGEATVSMDPLDPLATQGFPTAANLDGSNSSGPCEYLESDSRFRRLRFHAAGNLGEVHVAQDLAFDREVALKEIQGRHALDPQRRRRFLMEGEVTGRLEHPGIVPVYGIGTRPDGRPFYAMRFIRGETLGSGIARFQSQTPVRFDSLIFRQLLARFVAVCQAVGYAHSRGVLHRDLKPDNIMLGPYGETLVVDWGLAKVTARDDAPTGGSETNSTPAVEGTETGTIMGTPAFMSPEQASGLSETVGPASDVYALGATLYCLLTGRPPISGAPLDVIARSCAGDWVRPTAVRTDVPRPLEGVCLRAMALAPENRYASAVLLGQDVERWLADEPVTAYAEPFVARARRWVRKHPRSVTGLVVALLATVVGLSVVAGLIEQGKREAQKQFRHTRQAVRRFLVSVNEEDLMHEPGMLPLRQKLLSEALDYYSGYLETRPGDAEVLHEQADANRQLGELYADDATRLGMARAFVDRATVNYRELLAKDPTAWESRRGLAMAHLACATVHANAGEAAAELEAADNGVELLRSLSAERPDDTTMLRQLGRGHQVRAAALARGGDLGRALDANAQAGSAYWRAIFIAFQEYPGMIYNLTRNESVGDEPRGQFLSGFQLASTWVTQGELLDLAGRKTEAAATLSTATQAFRWFQSRYSFIQAYQPARNRQRIGLAVALVHGGRLEAEFGRPTRATPMLNEAAALAQRFLADATADEVGRYEEILALADGYLGECHLRTGNTALAADRLRDADTRWQRRKADGRGERMAQRWHARTLAALARLAEETGQFDAAIAHGERAERMQESVAAATPWDVALAGERLDTREARIRVRTKAKQIDPAQGIRDLERLLVDRTELVQRYRTLAWARAQAGGTAAELARRLVEAGRQAEAIKLVDSVLAAHEQAVREDGIVHRLTLRPTVGVNYDDFAVREQSSRLDPVGFPRGLGGRIPAREPDNSSLRRSWADLLAAKATALPADRRAEANELTRRAVAIIEELVVGGESLPLMQMSPAFAAVAGIYASRREPAYLLDLSWHLTLLSSFSKPGDDAAERAIAAIRELVASGYDRPARLATDPRLAALRTRAEFNRLVNPRGE